MTSTELLTELDVQEFQIDVLDSGQASAEAPTTTSVTISSWICVTVTIIAVSATATFDCIGTLE